MNPDRSRYAALLTLPLFLIILVLLVLLNNDTVFEPPLLLPLMNTVFLGIIPLFIAGIAFRTHRAGGSLGILLLGSGMLVFGLGSIAAGWLNSLPGGTNITPTIHNTAVCIGAIFSLAAVLLVLSGYSPKGTTRPRSLPLLLYGGLAAFIALFSFAAVSGMVPPFFIPGTGPTAVRQVILSSATELYALAAVMLFVLYSRRKEDFYFWFSVALGLVSIGLLAVFFQTAVGSMLGWAGRCAQYAGAVFALIAMLSARREAVTGGIPLTDQFTRLFSSGEATPALLAAVKETIMLIGTDGTILMANPTAMERFHEKNEGELVGRRLQEVLPSETARARWEKAGEVIHRQQPVHFEDEWDGTVYDHHFYPVLNTDHTVTGVAVFSRHITEQRRAEEEVKSAHERTAAILHQIADTFYSIDDQWRFTMVNPAAEKAPFGKPASELLGRVIWDLYPGLVGTRIQQHYFDALQNRTLEHYEARSPLNKRWYEVFMQGRKGGVDVYMRDITARMEAEGARKETLHRLHTLISGMQVGILLAWDGKVELANQTFCDYFWFKESPEDLMGMKTEEIIGRVIPAYPHPEEEEKHILGIIRDGRKVIGEETAMREGRIYLRDFIPVVVDGTPRGHLWYFVDITARKRAEEALRESENRYRDLVQTANSAIIRWSRDGSITFMNDYGLRFFGYSEAEIVGRDVRILLPRDGSQNNDMSFLVDKILSRPGQHQQNINENVCRDGRRVWMAWTNRPVHNADGQISEILAVGIDITEQKLAEEAMREAFERYDLVLKGAGAGIWDWDVPNHRVVFSKQWKAMRGYGDDEITGSENEWSSGIHPADYPRVMDAVQAHFTGKSPVFSVEYRVRRKDGSWIWILDRGIALRDAGGRVVRMAGSETDITGRKEAEVALQESELRYRTVADFTVDWEFWIGPDGKFLYQSRSAAERILGRIVEMYADAEPLFRMVMHKDDLAGRLAHLQDELAGRGPFENIEFRIVRPDGSVRWIQHNCRPIFSKEGIFLGSRGSNRDVTDRHAAEGALHEQEQRLQLALEVSRMGTWDLNLVRHTTIRSLRHDQIFGYETLLPDWSYEMFLDHVVPEDRETVDRKFREAVQNHGEWSFECRIQRRDGVVRWIHARGRGGYDEGGCPVRMIGIVQDITESKRTEEELQRSQAEIRALFDHIPAGLVLFDAKPPYSVLVHNRYYQEFFAEPFCSRGMVGLNMYEYAPEVEAAGVVAVFDRVVATKEPLHFLDFPYRSNPPEERWFNWYLAPIIIEGRVVSLVSMSLDITQAHRAEAVLKKEMQKLDILAESARLLLSTGSPEMIVQSICDRVMRQLDCQIFFNYLVGDSPDRMYLNAYAGIPEETARAIGSLDLGVAVCGCVARDGTRIVAENIQETGDDRTALVRSFGATAYACHPLLYLGKPVGTLSFGTRTRSAFTDDELGLMQAVTDLVATAMVRKKTVDALRSSEEQLRRAQELLNSVTKSSGVMIAAEDNNLCYTYFNKAYADEIQKITGKELSRGMSMVDLFAHLPDEQASSVRQWRKVLAGRSVRDTIAFDNPDGRKKIFNVIHTPIHDEDGRVIGAGEVSYDVTRQIETEAELRETSRYLENLLNYANAPIIVWDPAFRITRFNHAFERLTGMNAQDVIGKTPEILFPGQFRERAMNLIRRASTGDRWEVVEIPILHRNGDIRTVLWNSATLYGDEGKSVIATIAQGQDITERKQAENLIHEEKQRVEATLSLLNAALEATAEGVYVVDSHRNITSYNQNFAALWHISPGVLKTRDDSLITSLIRSGVKDPKGFSERLEEIYRQPEEESFDIIELQDGRIFERHSKPQRLTMEITGRVFSYRDITPHRQAENTLRESNREKEILLREIHHRVKNNLQIISGLLDMTRMRTEDRETNSILTDMMMKIKTMAQIHTRLYESRQFGMIDMAAQVRDQVADLSIIYGRSGAEITSEIELQEIHVPVDQAIPFALIVNESLSNAFKHAFRGRRYGNISISLVRNNGQVRISVRDNGVGLPEGMVFTRSNTLGLKLMRSLVQQLQGTLTINSDNGTEVIIEFPIHAEVV